MTDGRDASRRRRVLSELDANALNALQARPLLKSAPSPSRKPEPEYEPETGDRAEVGGVLDSSKLAELTEQSQSSKSS